MSEITDREYIKNILIKQCGFEENKELGEKLQLDGVTEICMDISSTKWDNTICQCTLAKTQAFY